MRLAILSDIHANLEAFEAVLEDARAQKCDEFLCLGDVVGYNANPRECLELVRSLKCPTVKGNHDEQASLPTSSRGFNEMAECAINWTRQKLDDSQKKWLNDLRLARQIHGFTIVHATLDDPEQWGYVLNNLDAAASFTYQHTPVCFFGHTHVQTVYVRDGHIQRTKLDTLHLKPDLKYFINAGSIGQPRDGDWRAAYCIYDTEEHTVIARRVKYDLATAQKKILKAGLPHLLADRLAFGK